MSRWWHNQDGGSDEGLVSAQWRLRGCSRPQDRIALVADDQCDRRLDRAFNSEALVEPIYPALGKETVMETKEPTLSDSEFCLIQHILRYLPQLNMEIARGAIGMKLADYNKLRKKFGLAPVKE